MHALITQDVCFDILFDDECSEVFGLEKLLGHLLHLLGCDVIYALEELMNVFFPTVVEETFAEVDGKLLAIVGCNAQLAFQLALGGLQLSGRKWALHQSVELAAHQSQAMLDVVMVATEVYAPRSCVGVECG